MNLDLEYFEPEEKYGSMKATVHRTGKLGFSSGAAKLIDFEKNSFFKIGRPKSQAAAFYQVLYMIPVTEKDDMTFEAKMAGEYWYLKIKRLLMQLGIEYRDLKQNIAYDVEEVNEGGKTVYKLSRKLPASQMELVTQ